MLNKIIIKVKSHINFLIRAIIFWALYNIEWVEQNGLTKEKSSLPVKM